MEGGRYGLQQAAHWGNSSALESYDTPHDSGLWSGGGDYGDRGYNEGRFPLCEGAPHYSSGGYEGDPIYDGDGFTSNRPGTWAATKCRTVEEELGLDDVACSRDRYQHDSFGRVKQDHLLYRAGREQLSERGFREHSPARTASHIGSHNGDSFDEEDDWNHHRSRSSLRSREASRELEQVELPRHHTYDSAREKVGRRGRDRGFSRWRRDRERDRSRSHSRSRSCSRGRDRGNWSPEEEFGRDRLHSHLSGEKHQRSRYLRSPKSQSQGEGGHQSSFEDAPQHESRSRGRYERDSNRYRGHSPLAPSATLVVKGLSQKTVEDDLYQALADWGPLQHVRVIKERSSGVSRGFAFVDFPSIVIFCPPCCKDLPQFYCCTCLICFTEYVHQCHQEAAQKMMDTVGNDGLVVDGRRLFFEYSSKPTGRSSGMQAGGAGGPAQGSSKGNLPAADWMCTVCGCNNFARRTMCFQCNEARTDESPAADMSVASGPGGRRGSQAGPTHVLVVRGLNEQVLEENLHCEFSKHAPIKDLRLVRDKFTNVSRGFAFIHFNSVEDAARALELTNGTALEKDGQLLRVAFAKSIGPSSTATPSQGSAAAAAAIEAAIFSQQYDMVCWAPKEYTPGEDIDTSGQQASHYSGAPGRKKGARGKASEDTTSEGEAGRAPQSGFVWDEASGYYYDAASGFYYDGHRGLYYDGNAAVWYTYNQETQQYIPYVEPSNGVDGETTDVTKGTGDVQQNPSITAKADVVGLAPPVMVVNPDAEEGKKPTLAEAVAAAAEAAKLAAKKEKERMKEKEKELRKAVTLGTAKKKINNVLTLWKQRQHEGLTPSAAGDAGVASVTTLEPQSDVDSTMIGGALSNEAATRFHSDMFSQGAITPSKSAVGRGMALVGGGKSQSGDYQDSEVLARARPISAGSSGLTAGRGSSVFGSSNSLFGDGAGPGRGSGRPSGGLEAGPSASLAGSGPVPSASGTPFKTNASALGSYSALAGTKRRFTESPQGGYRDRAAERRNLHGSTLPGDPTNETDAKEKGKEMPFPPGVGGRGIGAGRGSDMPFPPGVGGSTAIEGGVGAKSVVMAGPESHSFEVITAEKALDENNRGNRMLRNMGWQEGLGLGKEGMGIVEPVQAKGASERAGLGSQSQQQKTDARFETQPGDSYRIVIQKKALARFHDMI